MRLVYLVLFHLKLYSQNSYFLTNMLSLFLFQYILVSFNPEMPVHYIWVKPALVGLWTCGTTAAGVIGMQRFQGTLLYIVNNAVSDAVSLSAVVAPAALFGLLSFSVSVALSVLFGFAIEITILDVFYIICLWLGATVLDFLIAGLFVLTKNAIIYEEIITLPVLLLSGMFSIPHSIHNQ